MSEFDPVEGYKAITDHLAKVSRDDYSSSYQADFFRSQRDLIASEAGLDDDDIFDITFEREGWEERIRAKHPELRPDFPETYEP